MVKCAVIRGNGKTMQKKKILHLHLHSRQNILKLSESDTKLKQELDRAKSSEKPVLD